MSYPSIDELQKALASKVFRRAKDKKKAAGRALGTLVEIVTYYLLKSWKLEKSILIEKGLVEFGNPRISHNVEYTLHPIKGRHEFRIARKRGKTITFKQLVEGSSRLQAQLRGKNEKRQTICTSDLIIRNSCLLGSDEETNLVSFLETLTGKDAVISVVEQAARPFAMIECKRVGVEEGSKKGPQTIEKAKQGAYVAKAVSSLQKIRHSDGELYGVLPVAGGGFQIRKHKEMLSEIIASDDLTLLKNFILTVGVVSNHGNWFTSQNLNKELLVLAQAYDWLLFLSDQGLATFIDELILNPTGEYKAIKAAFEASYGGRTKGKNRFTKVQMDFAADEALQKYFLKNLRHIEGWFNIIQPDGLELKDLKMELDSLVNKKWF